MIALIVMAPSVAEQIARTDVVTQWLTFLVPPSKSPDAPSAPVTFQQAVGGASKGVTDEGESGSGFRVQRGGGDPMSAVPLAASMIELDATPGNPAEEYGEYFTIVDVDSAAVRHPESAAPVYPQELMRRGIEGYASLRFIVDSTGRIDLATVEVIASTRPEFARAVREALPMMRFRPAMMGTTPVRQLAEQMFRFKVQPAPVTPPVVRVIRPRS